MATKEEKNELVENLKGPRYYRLVLRGYGGEATYISISKEAFEFWSKQEEEHGDADLVAYMIDETNGDAEYENITEIPENAAFLKEGDHTYPWYDAPTIFEHTHGVDFASSHIMVEEIKSMDYMSETIRDVVAGEELGDYLYNVYDKEDLDSELVDYDCCTEPDSAYIAQCYSAEKGHFFETVIETVGDFDPKKLKVFVTEFLNGEDTVTSIEYEGEELENLGGDTNGKGISATVWSTL